MSLTVGTLHYLSTLADNKKGSLTNRHQAGVEHFKNDFKTGVLLTAPAIGLVVAKETGTLGKIAQGAGKVIFKGVELFAKSVQKSKLGKTLLIAAEKIGKNPKKAGAIGLAIAGGLYLSKVISRFSYNSGRIDQKYEDAAKIESQTKNVVLDDRFEKKIIGAEKKAEKTPIFYE